MSLDEVMAKFQPCQLDSQIEFDRMMEDMNQAQSLMLRPYLDKEKELAKQVNDLEIQKQQINIQLRQINNECVDLEQERKKINRYFHDLKHELIVLNPRERFIKPKEDE